MEPLCLELPAAAVEEDYTTILVVDPSRAVRRAFASHVESWGFDVLQADSGESALAVLETARPFVAFVDLAMSGLGGVELLEALSGRNEKPEVVLMTDYLDPSLAMALLEHGAFDYLRKPFLIDEVKVIVERVREHRRLRKSAIALQLLEETKRVERENLIHFMIGLANVIDAKSAYTKEHSDRVALYTKAFCRFLELPEHEFQDYSFGAKLHDIGKVGVPDRILDSTGKLTKEEREAMMAHPVTGARILEPIALMEPILPMVLRHHENWDGTGYPDGQSGEDTPLGARIVKIADYYDAITSKRPYRDPLPPEEATKVLESERDRLLDPELTRAFIELVRSGRLARESVSGVLPAAGELRRGSRAKTRT